MSERLVIHVVPHTHWDREWYEPFEGYRYRLIKTVDKLLHVLETDKEFRHFNFDGQTAAIEDYLEIRPEAAQRVARHVSSGRLAVGPWRILMDEFLCSPETIVRNIRQGTRSALELGRAMTIGYIPDSFGHISQMPQILRLAGLHDATVWRGVPRAIDRTMFRWVAPDGSEVRAAYLAMSYSNAASLPTHVDELLVRARRIVSDLAPFHPGPVVLAMNGSDHRAPEDHLPELLAEANAMQDEWEFRIGSMEEYFAVAPSGEDVPAWHGEMRSSARANLLMGVVSARMPLKQAEFAASTMLERYAEPLAALARADTGRLLERAWRWMVENSAHDSICGCGIDAVAQQVHARYVQAERIGELVAGDALAILASRVDTSSLPNDVEGLMIWNPSPRARTGVTEVTFTAPVGPERLALRAPDGSLHAAQVRAIEEHVVVDMTLRGTQLARIVPTIHSRMIGELHINHVQVEPGRITTVRLRLGPVPDGHLDVEEAKRRVEAVIARDPHAKFRVLGMGPPRCHALVATPAIGGLGWTVLEPVAGEPSLDGAARADGHVLDNGLLRVEVGADGRFTLIDHRDGTRYENLLGIEDGGDAGDEYTYSPPERDHVVAAPEGDVQVEEIEAGPVQATLRMTARYRIPTGLDARGSGRARRTTWLPVVTDLSLRLGEAFVRASIEIRNEAADHRVRALFPLPFATSASHADGAFDVVERGLTAEGGEHETGLATYPCRRWVDVSDGERGLALLHRGTPEYEVIDGRSLAITLLRGVGWLSRQGMQYRAGPAGPALATPGAQVRGTHRFDLAIAPHRGDWRSATIHDLAEAYTYPFRAAIVRAHEGSLPSAGSMLDLAPVCVQLSAFAPVGDAVECRIWNASPEAVDARVTLPPIVERAPVHLTDLHGTALTPVSIIGSTASLPLRGWEIATLRIG